MSNNLEQLLENEAQMRGLKIFSFNGEYEVFEAQNIRILMFCNVCKQWVIPKRLSLGKAHIYGLHCGVMQDLGCVFFNEGNRDERK